LFKETINAEDGISILRTMYVTIIG